MKESPWSRGDQHEKEVGPEEAALIRSEVAGRDELQQKHWVEGEKMLDREMYTFFRNDLIDAGGSYTRIHRVTPEGFIDPETDEGPPIDFDLLTCAMSDARLGTRTEAIPEDLRTIALEISQQFPDITFEFAESENRDTLIYKVTFRKE